MTTDPIVYGPVVGQYSLNVVAAGGTEHQIRVTPAELERLRLTLAGPTSPLAAVPAPVQGADPTGPQAHADGGLAGRRTPRPFVLLRRTDVTGVSGTGVVAEGVEFADGSVALRWLSDWPTSVVFHDRGIASVEHVHGHGGATEVVWLDGPQTDADGDEEPSDTWLYDAVFNRTDGDDDPEIQRRAAYDLGRAAERARLRRHDDLAARAVRSGEAKVAAERERADKAQAENSRLRDDILRLQHALNVMAMWEIRAGQATERADKAEAARDAARRWANEADAIATDILRIVEQVSDWDASEYHTRLAELRAGTEEAQSNG